MMRTFSDEALAAHDAETVRVTAETCAGIAKSDFATQDRIRHRFGLAPDEKGGA